MSHRVNKKEIGSGRNDLCRCGSGKKNKKCCMCKPINESSPLVPDFECNVIIPSELRKEASQINHKFKRNSNLFCMREVIAEAHSRDKEHL
jgi:hypothetical protein